jgi:hypothetical protein
MITDEMLVSYGFYQPANRKDWWHRDFDNVGIDLYDDGRYQANVGAQYSFLRSEAELKSFVSLMFLIGNPK